MPSVPVPILFISPSVKVLGARVSLLELLKHLDLTKWAPVVALPGRGGLESQLQALGIPVEVFFLRNYRKGKFILFRPYVRWKLRKICQKYGIKLIHCNEFWPFPYVRDFPGEGIPAVVHLRGPITPRQVRTYYLSEADRIVCISKGVAACLKGTGVWQDRIRIVPNGLALKDFSPDTDGRVLRNEVGLAKGDILLSLVGRITERKGHHFALEALHRVRQETGLPVHLAFFGEAYDHDEEYLMRLKERMNSEGLEKWVHFCGFRRPVAPALAATDVLILPSTAEGFGRVLIEAMAMEKPCVAFASEGVDEVIVQGVTGSVVPVGNVPALVSALIPLVKDAALRLQWGQAGAARVKEHFLIETHVARVEAVYNELLGKEQTAADDSDKHKH